MAYQVVKRSCSVKLSTGDIKYLPYGALVQYVDDKWFEGWKSHPFYNAEHNTGNVIAATQFGLGLVDPKDLEWNPYSF